MRRFRLLTGGALLLGGVLAAVPALAADAPQTRPPGAVACIDRDTDSQRAESPDALVFTNGSRAWRNHLRVTCPGLMRLNKSFYGLATEPHGSQLCQGDIVRVFDTTTVRTMGLTSFPACVLGWFEPIPKPPKHPKH